MKIVEIFRSIEGEGIRAGKLCTFVRSFGCNLRCSYCDSMYANEGTDYTEMSLEDIVEKCKELGTKCVTLTGGEPLIQPQIIDLIVLLIQSGFEINIETNGSVNISRVRAEVFRRGVEYLNNLFFTVDYKSPSSLMEDRMLMDNFIHDTRSLDVVKFVCGSDEDLQCMKDVVLQMRQYGSAANIFVSPVFGQIELPKIVNFLVEHDLQEVRMQLQMHKIIWDPDTKGV